jgi:hypothetical protein
LDEEAKEEAKEEKRVLEAARFQGMLALIDEQLLVEGVSLRSRSPSRSPSPSASTRQSPKPCQHGHQKSQPVPGMA